MRVTGHFIEKRRFLMGEKSGSFARDAATEWFVRLRDDAVSDADRAAFEAWRDADPAHSDAYAEMERLWSGLDQIKRRPGRPNGADGTLGMEAAPASSGRRRALRRMAIAASVAIAASLGAHTLSPTGFLADHRTGAGEHRKITLEDGSTVHLNTATALSAEFTANSRRITLHAGETYFEVAKDAGRPFIVDAEIGRIEALGTAFSVRRTEGAVEVIVTESRITVSAPGRGAAVLAVGQGIRVTDAGLGTVANVDPKMALAWRRGRLVFDNRPLGEVLAELARYRRGRIVTLDSAVEALPVTGSFAVADTDATLETIERTLPVHLYRLSDLLILVDAGPAP